MPTQANGGTDRSTRQLAGLAAAALAAALAVLALPCGRDEPPAAMMAPASTVAVEAAGPVATPAPTERSPAPRPAIGTPASDLPVVLEVVRAPTDAPVPNATVWTLDAAGLGRLLTTGPGRPATNARELVHLFARTQRARADGTVTVSATGPWLLAAAWRDRERSRAFAGFDLTQTRPGQPLRLRLEPRGLLSVTVVDSRDRPVAGVEIGIATADAPAPWVWRSIVTTNEDGRVVVDCTTAFPGKAPNDLCVVPLVPGCARCAVPLVAALRQPQLLRLPPTGSLQLRICDDDGQPLRAAVYLHAPADAGRVPACTATTVDGRATFAPVAAGAEFALRIDAGGERVDCALAGPSAAGAVRQHMITVAAAPALAGRLLVAGDRPLNSVELAATLTANQRRTRHQVTTDTEGRWRLVLPRRLLDSPLASLQFDWRPPSGAPASAHRRLDQLCRSGEQWVGDLWLAETPVLAAGQLRGERPGEAEATTFALFVPVAGTANAWQPLDPLHVLRSDGGRFVLHGLSATDRVRVQVRNPHRPPPPAIECAAGTGDLVLTLAPAVTVRVGVQFDPGVDASALRLLMTPHVPPMGPAATAQLDTVTTDGATFVWRSLAPGAHDLSLRVLGAPEPLLRRPGLGIADQVDQQLPVLDLRGRLRVLRVTVVDATRRPLASADGGVFVDGPTGEGFDLRSGIATIATAAVPVDLLVVVRGHHPVALPAVAADAEVQLQTLPRVAFLLMPSAATTAGTTFELHLARIDTLAAAPFVLPHRHLPRDELQGPDHTAVPLLPGAAAHCTLPLGRFRLHLTVREPRQPPRQLYRITPAELDVRAADDGRLVLVEPSSRSPATDRRRM